MKNLTKDQLESLRSQLIDDCRRRAVVNRFKMSRAAAWISGTTSQLQDALQQPVLIDTVLISYVDVIEDNLRKIHEHIVDHDCNMRDAELFAKPDIVDLVIREAEWRGITPKEKEENNVDEHH